MCFTFSPGQRETHKQFDPHPFPGQSREVVYVYWFFCPLIKESPDSSSGFNASKVRGLKSTLLGGILTPQNWLPLKAPFTLFVSF